MARFNTTRGQNDGSLIIGKLSSLNIWNSVLTQPEIRRFSIGCGNEAGNLLRWREMFNLASNVSARIQSTTCRHSHGKAEVAQQVLWGWALSLVYVSGEIVKFNSSHRIRHNRDSSIRIARNGNRWLWVEKLHRKVVLGLFFFTWPSLKVGQVLMQTAFYFWGGWDGDWLDLFTWPFGDILGRLTRRTIHCHRRREQNVCVCAFIASVALFS